METNNKIALVTGGSRGLGKEMAMSLAKKGINVLLTYNTRKDDALEVVETLKTAGVKAAALQLDAGNISSFGTFITLVSNTLKETFNAKRFDFLVNNAGAGVHVPFASTTEADFDLMMNMHFKGVFFLTQKALALINDGGRIVNISSGLARFSAPGYAAYASMKGAVETLSRYMASELGSRGIAVNTVAPGAIETDFGGGAVRDNPQYNKFIAEATALGRAGKPDDIGGIVAFLCTEDAKWINAQRIEASGGMNI